jgi:hypothetical protein
MRADNFYRESSQNVLEEIVVKHGGGNSFACGARRVVVGGCSFGPFRSLRLSAFLYHCALIAWCLGDTVTLNKSLPGSIKLLFAVTY